MSIGGRRARLLVGAALAIVAFGASATGASAATVTTDCAHLQTTLDAANTGDTVVLDQLCTGSDFNLDNGSSRSYTVRGQPGTGAGFDGTGSTTSMLHANGGSGNISVNDLVFQNSPNAPPRDGGALVFQGAYSVTLSGDTFTNNVGPSGGIGGAVAIETTAPSATVTITDDTFTGNQAGVAGGAVELTDGATSGSVTVSNSSFINNTAHTDTGGAVDLCECGAPLPVTLSHNTFSGNKVVGGGCGCALGGGAVFLDNSVGGNAVLTQSGNTFSGNSLTGGTATVQGGAEAALGMTLSSTGDTFTGNSIQAPVGSNASQGAALSLENDCSAPVPQHTLTNAAIAGNSIADGGAAAKAEGALGLGCTVSFADPSSLLLRDSTISANKGGGGTAGVWGDATDQLTVQNSILNGDSDRVEVTGFTGTGGSVAATYSDLCNGSSPFLGTGNICAPPALANASSGDVHETSSSPTVEAGSNALVPSGLSTDVYGAARLQPRVSGNTPVVDIGAAELPSIPAPPTAAITTPATGAIYALGQVVNSSFTCTEGSGGPGISSCIDQNGQGSGAAIDTSTLGQHTLTVTAASSDGQTGAASVTYTVAAAPSIAIASPSSGARYAFGQKVLAGFTCAEGSAGPGISSCVGTVANGAALNTATPGKHSFTVTATSADGQVTRQTITYTVLLPSNKLTPIRRKPHRDGTFIVVVKVPGPGIVDILVTAWKDNFATIARLLQPAPGRFVFARAHARARRAGTLTIVVTPNGRGRLLVANHRYRVTLRLWISYTPTHGRQRDLGYYGIHLP